MRKYSDEEKIETILHRGFIIYNLVVWILFMVVSPWIMLIGLPLGIVSFAFIGFYLNQKGLIRSDIEKRYDRWLTGKTDEF